MGETWSAWRWRGLLAGPVAALFLGGCFGEAALSGVGAPGSTGGATDGKPPAVDGNPPVVSDPSCDEAVAGRVPARRLTRDEYANSVRDLLHLDASVDPAKDLAPESYSLESFENEASLLQMSPDRAEGYLTGAARSVATAWTQSRDQWLLCDVASAGRSCAEETLTRLATRAYRRPVTQDEIASLLAVYDASVSEGAQVALQRSVQAILVSPRFLYLAFGAADGITTGIHTLNDYELAARLSYFLWRSLPDDTLFDIAGRGELKDPAVLRAQVERMLDDPRSDFVEGFARGWLALDEVKTVSVDDALFPGLTPELRNDLIRETEAFVDYVVRERRPLRELFLADYSFMNARLAAHYGLGDLAGDTFQKVPLPADGSRRGLISHASVLTVNAGSATRTATTVRGHWVLEKILCKPPPPAPPNIPALGEKPGTSEGTLKQRLEAHRADPACAGCHQMMDPVGMGLENFDVLGKWRTQYADGSPVEADGMFPDGTTFTGPAELLTWIGNGEDVEACVAEKLMSYALGRRVAPEDHCTAKTIGKVGFEPGNSLVDIIVGVVMTRQFQQNAQEVTK